MSRNAANGTTVARDRQSSSRSRLRAAPCRCAIPAPSSLLRRRADRDDLAAGLAAFGTEIDQPVGRRDHIEVVLDDQQRMAGRDQTAEGAQQLGDVVEVQARGGLVEQKQLARRGAVGMGGVALTPPGGRRASGAGLRRRTRSVPAGRGAGNRGRLRRAAAACASTSGSPAKKLHRFGDRHVEHVGDALCGRASPGRDCRLTSSTSPR